MAEDIGERGPEMAQIHLLMLDQRLRVSSLSVIKLLLHVPQTLWSI